MGEIKAKKKSKRETRRSRSPNESVRSNSDQTNSLIMPPWASEEAAASLFDRYRRSAALRPGIHSGSALDLYGSSPTSEPSSYAAMTLGSQSTKHQTRNTGFATLLSSEWDQYPDPRRTKKSKKKTSEQLTASSVSKKSGSLRSGSRLTRTDQGDQFTIDSGASASGSRDTLPTIASNSALHMYEISEMGSDMLDRVDSREFDDQHRVPRSRLKEYGNRPLDNESSSPRRNGSQLGITTSSDVLNGSRRAAAAESTFSQKQSSFNRGEIARSVPVSNTAEKVPDEVQMQVPINRSSPLYVSNPGPKVHNSASSLSRKMKSRSPSSLTERNANVRDINDYLPTMTTGPAAMSPAGSAPGIHQPKEEVAAVLGEEAANVFSGIFQRDFAVNDMEASLNRGALSLPQQSRHLATTMSPSSSPSHTQTDLVGPAPADEFGTLINMTQTLANIRVLLGRQSTALMALPFTIKDVNPCIHQAVDLIIKAETLINEFRTNSENPNNVTGVSPETPFSPVVDDSLEPKLLFDSLDSKILKNIFEYLDLTSLFQLTSCSKSLYKLRRRHNFAEVVLRLLFGMEPSSYMPVKSNRMYRHMSELYRRVLSTRTEPGRALVLRGHVEGSRQLLSIGGSIYTCGGPDNTVCRWNVGSNAMPIKEATFVDTINAAHGVLYSGRFAPDLLYVSGGESASGVTIWDQKKSQRIGFLYGPQSWVARMRFSDEGKIVMSGADRRLWVFDAETCKVSMSRDSIHRSTVFDVLVNGNEIVTCGLDGIVQLWDSRTLERVASVRSRYSDGIVSLYGYDDSIVCGANGFVGFLDRRMHEFYENKTYFSGWTTSIDRLGYLLCFGGQDRQKDLSIVHASTQSEIIHFNAHDGCVRSLSVGWDYIVTSGMDTNLKLWYLNV